MWATLIPLIFSLFGDLFKSIFNKAPNERVEFAKSVRQAYDDHEKAWAKAKATGDTSDLEQLP